MKHFLLLFLLISHTFSYQPGLKIPSWYQWDLKYKNIPELKKPFVVEFTFRSTYATLNDLNLHLILPDGVSLLEGEYSFSIKKMDKDKTITKSFLLKSNREIRGLSFQLSMRLKFPHEAIISEVKSLYSQQETHQLKQLLNKIKGMSTHTMLHFQKPLYLLETEGFKEIPPFIFSNLHQAKGHPSPFLLFSLNNKLSNQQVLNKITKFEENLNHLMADAQAFESYVSSYPTEYQSMLQENYYDYYHLAFLKFNQGKFDDADQWLQKLTSILLTEEKINYDFFLVIQNLRALCNLKSKKKSIKILSSAIRTAANSKVRHYLMYNLAVIYEKAENKQQLKHYLKQSLGINPSFTIAKTMQTKHKSF
ncbi:hypothetical protein MJH12_05525 [bacterium]|nr:hypothetical protein [bacterium]